MEHKVSCVGKLSGQEFQVPKKVLDRASMPLGLTNLKFFFSMACKASQKEMFLFDHLRTMPKWSDFTFSGHFLRPRIMFIHVNMSHKNALERKDSEFYPRRVNPNRRLRPKIPFSLKFPAWCDSSSFLKFWELFWLFEIFKLQDIDFQPLIVWGPYPACPRRPT